MSPLTIDGHNYSSLDIIDYEIGLEVLDGEATGRTRAHGWSMIRDPQGAMSNLYVEIGTTSSGNPDFVRLWRLCKSMGSRDFATVSFVDPIGDIVTERMYLNIARLKLKKIEKNGKVYTHSVKISFICQEGR